MRQAVSHQQRCVHAPARGQPVRVAEITVASKAGSVPGRLKGRPSHPKTRSASVTPRKAVAISAGDGPSNWSSP